MTKQINIVVGQAINGGPGLGIMTSASNPWTVTDGLADELVNRKVATYVTGQPVPSQYGTPLWADQAGTTLVKPDGGTAAIGSSGVTSFDALTDKATADIVGTNSGVAAVAALAASKISATSTDTLTGKSISGASNTLAVRIADLSDTTAFVKTLLDDADAAAARATLGIVSGGSDAETLAESAFGMVSPRAIGTATLDYIGVATANGMDGSTANGNAVTTDLAGTRRRVRWTAAATANNRVAGATHITPFRLDSGGTFNGGFPLVIEACPADATAGASFFMGIQNSATPNFTATEPTAWSAADILGAGWDSTGANSSNLCIIWNNNVGTPNVIDLGSNFAKAQGQVFRVVIDKNAAGTELYVKVVKVVTGGANVESAVYTLTTDIPRGTVVLYPCYARSSMASGALVSLDFAILVHGKLPSAGSALQPINEQTGSSYALVITDFGQQIDMNNAGANSVVIPLEATVKFPPGTLIPVVQKGAGATTITIAGGGTLQKPAARSFTISAQYEGAMLHYLGSDTWRVLAS